jgi:hypothetical protein
MSNSSLLNGQARSKKGETDIPESDTLNLTDLDHVC